MGEESPRAVMLGMLRLERKLTGEAIAALPMARALRPRR